MRMGTNNKRNKMQSNKRKIKLTKHKHKKEDKRKIRVQSVWQAMLVQSSFNEVTIKSGVGALILSRCGALAAQMARFLLTMTSIWLIPTGWAASLRSTKTGSSAGWFQYDYHTHGQDWMMGQCGSRQRQSPIDFLVLPEIPSGSLTYKYEVLSVPFEFTNTGHAFSADVGGLGYGGVTYQNAWYNLININIHRSLNTHGETCITLWSSTSCTRNTTRMRSSS